MKPPSHAPEPPPLRRAAPAAAAGARCLTEEERACVRYQAATLAAMMRAALAPQPREMPDKDETFPPSR